MKTGLLALACLIAMGVIAAPVAEAKPGPKSRHHVVRKSIKKTGQSGGVTVSTQDVDGDGTGDVVVVSRPKPKPRKHKQ